MFEKKIMKQIRQGSGTFP